MKDITLETFKQLICDGRKSREKKQVTGLNIFANGNNLILAEGEKQKVCEDFELTKRHASHHSIIKIFEGTIPCRFFEDYPLGLKIMGPKLFKNLDSFLSQESGEYFQEFLNIDHKAVRIVKSFIRNNT